MSTPNFLVYNGSISDGVPPYRPGVDSVGGNQKLDDAEFPPDPVTMFTAADFNQHSGLLVALCKVTPAALFLVANAGTPSISGLRAAGSLLVIGDFTVIDRGIGDTEITCPASKIMQPFAAIGFSQGAGDFRVSARVNGTNDGIRIETRNSGGALADMNFFAMWV
jgi:hypothetical protein